jgi:hypothetical protein
MPVVVYGNTTICENTTQEYHVDSVPGAVSYVWSIPSTWTGSSTTDSISIIADYNAGNIVVYAVNSCGGGAAQQLWVTVQTPPSIPMLSWADTVACDSSNVSYGVIYDLNVDSFTWTLPMNWTGTSTISTMYAFAATNGGQVTVVENNSCGIGPPLVINVTINPLPIVTMAPFGVICDTLTSFILTGGSPAGGIYYGTGVYNDSLYNPSISGAGTYPITYVYTDTNSCASQAVADIQVDLCLQVNEFINPENSFEVYPNPFAGTISILTKMKGSFVVVNIVGEVVFSTETISNKASIDLSYLSPGIYFVQISSGQVVKTTKLVKE